MALHNKHINVILTAEQQASILAAVETMETAVPFLISLTPEERKRLFKLGMRSEGFVTEAITAARQYPDRLPASLSVADLERDLALRETLLPVLQRVRTLYTKLNDTWMLAGADAMQMATAIYRLLRAQRGEGLDTTLDMLQQRFQRSSTPTTPEEPPLP